MPAFGREGSEVERPIHRWDEDGEEEDDEADSGGDLAELTW
jgi:hypothetical protein